MAYKENRDLLGKTIWFKDEPYKVEGVTCHYDQLISVSIVINGRLVEIPAGRIRYTPPEPVARQKIVSFSSPPDFPGIDPDVVTFIQGQGMRPRNWLFPDKLIFGYGIAVDGTIWGVKDGQDVYFEKPKTKKK